MLRKKGEKEKQKEEREVFKLDKYLANKLFPNFSPPVFLGLQALAHIYN